MATKKTAASKPAEITEVTATAPAQTTTAPANKKVDQRINVQQMLLLISIFLQEKHRNDDEKRFAEASLDLFKTEGTSGLLADLESKGYLENGKITKFGERMVLQSTSPTPNFKNLAESGMSTALKMFLVSGDSILEKHGAFQNKIRPGKDANLVWELNNLCNDVLDSLILPEKEETTKA